VTLGVVYFASSSGKWAAGKWRRQINLLFQTFVLEIIVLFLNWFNNSLAFQQFGITHTKTTGGGISPLQLVNAT
jgi:hypothetical protein